SQEVMLELANGFAEFGLKRYNFEHSDKDSMETRNEPKGSEEYEVIKNTMSKQLSIVVDETILIDYQLMKNLLWLLCKKIY
ncbi:hypothetical protein N6D09_001910, partial [Listeria monocytogenes]|nr:hypothetical protein [Listeria monocytogenes]